MRVAIGADHAGFSLKEDIKGLLAGLGIDVEDVGTGSTESVDYPDFAARVARGVAEGVFDRGILVCGTGIGMAMAANKIAGVRAAPATGLEGARLSRQHNDANVLTLGARITAPALALDIVRTFLETPFEGGRHRHRVDKIADLERR